MAREPLGLMQGTVDVLILKTLTWGPMHGYGIASWIESATSDVLRVEEGSLYPALYRMTRKGWIKGDWGTSENNRRARYYRLTARGRSQLRAEESSWRAYAPKSSAARGLNANRPALRGTVSWERVEGERATIFTITEAGATPDHDAPAAVRTSYQPPTRLIAGVPMR